MIGNIVNNVVSSIAPMTGGGSPVGGGSSGSGVSDLFDFASPGGMLEGLCDSLGLPDWAGDIAKTCFSCFTGDVPGATSGFLDVLEDAFEDVGMEELGAFCKSASEVTSGFSTTGMGGGSGLDPSTIATALGGEGVSGGDIGSIVGLLAGSEGSEGREVRV